MDFTTIKKNLEELEYKVSCFETAEEAAEYLNSQIDNASIGFGGSVTLDKMGLYDMLSTHNNVLWHHIPKDGKTKNEIQTEASTTDIYISSVNGIAETGEIINIDGNCNRVASTIYGHKKVYFVVGLNKIAEDYDSALWRARNIAAPLNAKRLNRNTPCAVKGDRCYNCKSPDRICRALTVLWSKPLSCEIEVILIAENLGY